MTQDQIIAARPVAWCLHSACSPLKLVEMQREKRVDTCAMKNSIDRGLL